MSSSSTSPRPHRVTFLANPLVTSWPSSRTLCRCSTLRRRPASSAAARRQWTTPSPLTSHCTAPRLRSSPCFWGDLFEDRNLANVRTSDSFSAGEQPLSHFPLCSEAASVSLPQLLRAARLKSLQLMAAANARMGHEAAHSVRYRGGAVRGVQANLGTTLMDTTVFRRSVKFATMLRRLGARFGARVENCPVT